MNPPIHRRLFLMTLATSTAAIGSCAYAQTMLDEKDPQAVALGYVADARRVDSRKFPKYAAGQVCSNCAVYKGSPADKAGGCAIFGTRLVAGPGWCSAWARKG